MIKNYHYLNEQQLVELNQLKTLCKKIDGSTPNLYPHILANNRTFPVNYLYYEEEELVGFLSVFFFYDNAVEFAVLVHPDSRRHGIAQQLIQEAIPIVQMNGFDTVIFSSPYQLNTNWLQAQGFTKLHSEYYMERDDLNPLLEYNETLTFHEATVKDIDILCALDEVCFPKKESKPIERFQQLFTDRNYQIFVVYQNNQPIGKAHLRWEKRGATISDISILPILQGKGYGTALIAHCINYALSEGKPHLNLDVETHNKRALNLYVRLGFIVQNACDYWSIALDQLRKP